MNHLKHIHKTEINRMSTADLKKLASENGIENATENKWHAT